MEITVRTREEDLIETLRSEDAPFEFETTFARIGGKSFGGEPGLYEIGIIVSTFAGGVASKVIASWIYDKIKKRSENMKIDAKPVGTVTEIEHIIEEKRTAKTTTRKDVMKIRIVR